MENRLALEEGAMDMMEKIYSFYRARNYKDALKFLSISKDMLKKAGYTPERVALAGFMPPAEFRGLKTVGELEERIRESYRQKIFAEAIAEAKKIFSKERKYKAALIRVLQAEEELLEAGIPLPENRAVKEFKRAVCCEAIAVACLRLWFKKISAMRAKNTRLSPR